VGKVEGDTGWAKGILNVSCEVEDSPIYGCLWECSSPISKKVLAFRFTVY